MLPRGWGRKRRTNEIEPDEIFIDSSNLPAFDRDQFEGRIEQPIKRSTILLTGILVTLLLVLYAGRAFDLAFINGTAYAKQAAENQLTQAVVFADRGVIIDRNGKELAYNTRSATSTDEFAARTYAPYRGLAHVVGYVKSPAKDSSGTFYRDSFVGIDGAEQAFDGELQGQNGLVLTETDAHGKVVSQSTSLPPQTGQKITLSVDADLTQGLYDAIAQRAQDSNFQGGAGVIMDIHTGEIMALTSYPDYSSQLLSDGDRNALVSLDSNPRQPFLNRVTDGLYAPGSIVKPFVGVGALVEGVIDENKKILSTGSISIPNPYDPAHPSVFKDWRPQGWVDIRDAIAVSSDVYFYEVGGGYQDQPGLGIDNIDKYLRLFGFGSEPGLTGFSQKVGTIPTPAWKEENFPGDPWRIGDTYHTAIGQYGVQVTPLQAVRAVAALANGGTLLTPTLLASTTPVKKDLGIPSDPLEVVREGMRQGVQVGIAGAVNVPFVNVAAKTGTAQVGSQNQFENSWMIGFFPYEHPKYAYAVVLERGPAGTTVGAPAAMNTFLWWLSQNEPQYFQ
jgi:penicillin-binding protein 2